MNAAPTTNASVPPSEMASAPTSAGDRMSQPVVSSTTPAERMTTPMLRRVRSRSRRILAMTGIALIDIAVAKKSAKIVRWSGAAT